MKMTRRDWAKIGAEVILILLALAAIVALLG